MAAVFLRTTDLGAAYSGTGLRTLTGFFCGGAFLTFPTACLVGWTRLTIFLAMGAFQRNRFRDSLPLNQIRQSSVDRVVPSHVPRGKPHLRPLSGSHELNETCLLTSSYVSVPGHQRKLITDVLSELRSESLCTGVRSVMSSGSMMGTDT